MELGHLLHQQLALQPAGACQLSMGRPVTPLVLDAFGGADLLEGRLRKVRRLPLIIHAEI